MTEDSDQPPVRDGRRPTIYDVATRAGVSKSLVSLVLQGSAQVSAERRAAVERAISDLQYRPSRAAAALAGTRIRTIGVLLDDYRNLWFVELLEGIQEELAPLGFRIAVESTTSNAHVDPSPLDGFVSLRVDGIVIATEPTEAMAATMGIPIVVAGTRELQLPGADIAGNDDRLGGQLATEHLLGLGHRHLGHLSGGGGSARLRAEGFIAAQHTAGLPPVIVGHDNATTEADGYQTAHELLAEHPDTTAVFAANDVMALGAAAAARDLGRRIPADLSLIGYDNSALASSQLLRLSTIDAQSRLVGQEAARALISRIDDPQLATRVRLVQPELVIRASTAAPPG